MLLQELGFEILKVIWFTEYQILDLQQHLK